MADKSWYKQLRFQSLENQREHYDDKNMILESFGDWECSATLYEDVFDDLEQIMPIVILDEEEQKHILKMSIYEAMEQADGRNDVLMGGCTYFNNFISKATAKNIHALIIDMDNVYSGILLTALQNNWRSATGEEIPLPTYIVNSGTGLHLYFVFDKPLPYYKSQAAAINQLYRRLAIMETTKRNYLRKSVQWFGQDFRMAGGNGKNGWENTVFRIGDKWSADALGKAVGLNGVHFLHEGDRYEQKKNKKMRDRKSRKCYYLNARVYETSVERCRNETQEGNRYMSMCALSVLAYKCNVSISRLETDLNSLLPNYNNNARRLVKPQEIKSAMKMYNPKAIDTPRVRSEEWLGWEFKGSRRNGRKQDLHLRLARANRDILCIEKGKENWWEGNGRPKAKSKQRDRIKAWREAYPEGRKIDCHRETKISRPTIDRWWKE